MSGRPRVSTLTRALGARPVKLDRYGHLLPGLGDSLADALDQAYESAGSPPSNVAALPIQNARLQMAHEVMLVLVPAIPLDEPAKGAIPNPPIAQVLPSLVV